MIDYVPINLKSVAGQGYLPTDKPLSWALQYTGYPVATSELTQIISWYPVVFSRIGSEIDMVMPVSAIPGKSALINEETGKWTGRDLPFCLRQFPFALGYETSTENAAAPMLLLADVPDAQLSSDAPRPLVEADGSLSDLAKAMILRIIQHDKVRALDRKRIQLIEKLGLLVPHEIQFAEDGMPEAAAESMFLRINEAALMDLPIEAIAEMHALKAWRMVYGHLFSLRQSGKPAIFRKRILNRQDTSVDRDDTLLDILGDDGNGLISF